MSVKGREGVKRLLGALKDPASRRGIERALFAGAQRIVTEAQVSITTGAVSGANHVPSLPGQPPNNDTGTLARNIEATLEGPLRAIAASNASYSRPLEFGTSKMAARPFMRPAAAKVKDEVTASIAAAVAKALRDKA